jgi:hypothetical protein
VRAFLLREGDRIRVITPYVPDFVTDLKAEIPYYAKSFDRDSKHWLVDGEYEETVLEVASHYFETTVVVSESDALRRERAARASAAAPPPPSPPSPHDANECARRVRGIWKEEAELYLLPGAPWSVIEAVYRAVAKLTHPDLVGPSGNARMVAVNRAYDVLKKRFGGAA